MYQRTFPDGCLPWAVDSKLSFEYRDSTSCCSPNASASHGRHQNTVTLKRNDKRERGKSAQGITIRRNVMSRRPEQNKAEA